MPTRYSPERDRLNSIVNSRDFIDENEDPKGRKKNSRDPTRGQGAAKGSGGNKVAHGRAAVEIVLQQQTKATKVDMLKEYTNHLSNVPQVRACP